MHPEFTQLMSLALDGEASQAETRRLRQHLGACPACAEVWAQWQAVDQRLTAAPQVTPAVNLASLVSARLAERDLKRRRTRWIGSGLLLTWVLVFAIVLAGIGGGISLVASHPQQTADALSWLARLLAGIAWLLQATGAFLSDLGAPRLAAGLGLLATLTCGLAMMWLWVMGRQRWVSSPALVGK